MDQHDMIALVERHLKAEGAGDIDGAVAVYTDDIEHDAVGFPGSPRTGKDAAREFYGFLTANFRTEDEQPLHRYFSDDSMILEQSMTGTVIGEMLGIPGNNRRVTFRILHVFDFRDGLIRPRAGVDRQRRHRRPAHQLTDEPGSRPGESTASPSTRPSDGRVRQMWRPRPTASRHDEAVAHSRRSHQRSTVEVSCARAATTKTWRQRGRDEA